MRRVALLVSILAGVGGCVLFGLAVHGWRSAAAERVRPVCFCVMIGAAIVAAMASVPAKREGQEDEEF